MSTAGPPNSRITEPHIPLIVSHLRWSFLTVFIEEDTVPDGRRPRHVERRFDDTKGSQQA
jgi:hypothetical protein